MWQSYWHTWQSYWHRWQYYWRRWQYYWHMWQSYWHRWKSYWHRWQHYSHRNIQFYSTLVQCLHHFSRNEHHLKPTIFIQIMNETDDARSRQKLDWVMVIISFFHIHMCRYLQKPGLFQPEDCSAIVNRNVGHTHRSTYVTFQKNWLSRKVVYLFKNDMFQKRKIRSQVILKRTHINKISVH